jgi:hypothetical protein
LKQERFEAVSEMIEFMNDSSADHLIRMYQHKKWAAKFYKDEADHVKNEYACGRLDPASKGNKSENKMLLKRKKEKELMKGTGK